MSQKVKLQTDKYSDGRPDALFFMADIDGVIVSIRENLPTYGVTDGEVWVAFMVNGARRERRFTDVEIARRELAGFVRDSVGRPHDTVAFGKWRLIRREEYAVACSICKAERGQPCVDEDGPMIGGKATVLVVGAPWHPAPEEHEVNTPPLVHAGRCTDFFRSLRDA